MEKNEKSMCVKKCMQTNQKEPYQVTEISAKKHEKLLQGEKLHAKRTFDFEKVNGQRYNIILKNVKKNNEIFLK